MIPRLFHEHARAGFLVFSVFVALIAAALYMLGDRPVWVAHWREPYSVEVCVQLLESDPDAIGHIAAAYGHIEIAGHPVPTRIDVGDCTGPVDGVRWGPGVPAVGRAGETHQEHAAEVMLSAVVVLDRGRLSPDLYRHEAWHTIGADHPWMPSTDHVLHPGGPGHVWGTATRGYER